MKAISRLMIICLLTIVVTTIASYNLSEGFDFGECPSCWAWRCDEYLPYRAKVCMVSCMEETSEYRFYVQIYKWDEQNLMYIYDWQWVLMVLGPSSNCDEPCYEYTCSYYLPSTWDGFTGEWYVKDMVSGDLVCAYKVFFPDPFE